MLAQPTLPIDDVVRRGIARALAVVGLAGVALIHLLDAPGTFAATPYKGVFYALLILGSLAAAAVLLGRDDRRAWLAAVLLPLGAAAAFVVSRTAGLPQGAGGVRRRSGSRPSSSRARSSPSGPRCCSSTAPCGSSQARRPRAGKEPPVTPAAARPWRILVVADETVDGERLHELVGGRAAAASTRVLVLAPMLAGRLAYWASDDRRARREALDRLGRSIDALRARGVDAEGGLGDADPVLAIEDALHTFPADEVVLATRPRGRSSWLERNVLERARARCKVPVHHLVDEIPSAGEPQRSLRWVSSMRARFVA